MRLFYALELDSETKDSILLLQEDLASYCPDSLFTMYENLLITLCFLGDIEAQSITLLKEILFSLTTHPISLTLDHLRLHKRSKGGLLWLGVKENRSLEALQKELSYLLEANNFLLDDQAFTPHITLAREAKCKKLPAIEAVTVQSSKISLMHSYQKQGIFTYTPLHTLELT